MNITEEQWYAHPSFRQELAELLKHPTLQVALGVTKRLGLKKTGFPTGLNLMHYFALMGSKRDGYFEGLQNLEDLAKPQVVKPPDLPPWKTPPPTGPDTDTSSAP